MHALSRQGRILSHPWMFVKTPSGSLLAGFRNTDLEISHVGMNIYEK